MRALGRSQTVARGSATDRLHELAVALVLVVPRDGAAAVEHRGATPNPITTEGGILRFALSRDAREDER
jgi:hypothetical protein